MDAVGVALNAERLSQHLGNGATGEIGMRRAQLHQLTIVLGRIGMNGLPVADVVNALAARPGV